MNQLGCQQCLRLSHCDSHIRYLPTESSAVILNPAELRNLTAVSRYSLCCGENDGRRRYNRLLPVVLVSAVARRGCPKTVG